MTEPGPPGWYPDPWGTDKHRWFDGAAWTPQVWPPDVEPAAARATDAPPRHAEQEQRFGRVLVAVMPIAALALVATVISTLAVLRWVADNWSEFTDAAEAGRRLEPVVPGWVSALSWMGQFPLLAIQVLFLVWCYQAARVGRDLGFPARRGPGWAVGGWLIPVVNLWWPYQSVSDSVPPGDPARAEIRRWWELWIAVLASSVLVFASAFFTVTASFVAVGVQGALAIGAALAARRMIIAILHVHATATRR